MIRPCRDSNSCADDIFGNLSVEEPDNIDFISQLFVPQNPPLLRDWTGIACDATCVSQVSQLDADLCAARLANDCGVTGNPPGIQNTPQTCCVPCPDGTQSCYTTPAGQFTGLNQADADSKAHDFACQQAKKNVLCLGNIDRCTCKNATYLATLSTGTTQVTWKITDGSLPAGVNLVTDPTKLTITGVPIVSGTFTFTIQATTSDGFFSFKQFTLTVIEITTTSLPAYTVGTPYSTTLVAVGGSGHYAWKIVLGSLPDGLVLELNGLIHGTPTGINTGTSPLVFSVIDQTCEAINDSFFTPRVSLVTRSQTTVATVLGYPEFANPSSPPKKYHSLTWDGFAQQQGLANIDLAAEQPCGSARFEWSGTGTIDSKGNQISNYVKNLFLQCSNPPRGLFVWPFVRPAVIDGNNVTIIPTFIGYCWPPDNLASCHSCPTDLVFAGNLASNSERDGYTGFLNDVLAPVHSSTPTQVINNSSAGFTLALFDETTIPGQGVTNFPLSTLNGQRAHWFTVTSTHNVTGTLTDEYTDAEALANALVVNSVGNTAQTLARTTGFVSTWTTVAFDLNFTNLVSGRSYLATVTLLDSDNTKTIVPYLFTASGKTFKITDSIPIPAQGHTITVKTPLVAFA